MNAMNDYLSILPEVADALNDPTIIAADLLSQSEHDPTSQSILFTDDGDFADAVAAAVAHVVPTLATAPTMQESWAGNGAVIVVPNLADAIPLCDRLAPEHLRGHRHRQGFLDPA